MAKATTIFVFTIFILFVSNEWFIEASLANFQNDQQNENMRKLAETQLENSKAPHETIKPKDKHPSGENDQLRQNQQPNEDLPPGKTLPNTGYWNYLLIFGLKGRLIHYLLTNTNGFGNEIKRLDTMLKSALGEDVFVHLEKEVVESFDLPSALFSLGNIIHKIKNVQDPISKKTLGDAFQIIQNLSADQTIVKQFVKRLNMIDNLDTIFKNPYNSPLEEMKETVNDPSVLLQLLSDPTIMNKIFETVLRSLTSEHFTKGVESIKKMGHLLIRLYPHKLETTWNELLRIKDPQSKVSLQDDLQSIRNIMETNEFKSKIEDLLNKTSKQQSRVVPFIMKHGGIISHSTPSASKPLIDELTSETCREYLSDFGVKVSQNKAEKILNDARGGTLFNEFNKIIENAEGREGGLIPQNIAAEFKKDNIEVTPERVAQVIELITLLPTELITAELNINGIKVSPEDIAKLKEKTAKAMQLPETSRIALESDIEIPEDCRPEEPPNQATEVREQQPINQTQTV